MVSFVNREWFLLYLVLALFTNNSLFIISTSNSSFVFAIYTHFSVFLTCMYALRDSLVRSDNGEFLYFAF